MQVSLKVVMVSCLCSAVIGAVLCKKYAKVEVATVTNEVTKDRIVTVVKHVKEKDGDEVTETTTTEDRQTSKQVVAAAKKPHDWVIGIKYDTNRDYEAQLNRRILGPVFVGVTANSNKTIGLVLSYEF